MRVADEVNSWIGRRRTSAARLATRMGVSPTYLYRRLNGETPFSTDDLFALADLLNVPADVFWHVERGDAANGRRLAPATPLRRSRGSQAPSRSKSIAAIGVSCPGVSRKAA